MPKTVLDAVVPVADLAQAIREEYPEFQTPADQIVIDSDVSEQFAARVSKRLGLRKVLDATTVNKRLLNERKCGRLPRLERAFNGRNIRIDKPR
jgi:hypothetical protein